MIKEWLSYTYDFLTKLFAFLALLWMIQENKKAEI